jgi:hypothetical protein
MAKKKHDKEMVATAVRLPQNLRDRLAKVGGGQGLGEEIRRRLEASFVTEAATNPKTVELLDAIAHCAERTASDYGRWSDDAFSFEVLKGCLDMLLAANRPKGEPVPKPNPEGMHDILFGKEHSPKPEELSRLYVSGWLGDRAKRVAEEERK